MAFMEPQVTGRQTWLKIDGSNGITWIPSDIFRKPLHDYSTAELLEAANSQFYEGVAESVEIVRGFGARFSAPGYLDCTEWTVFDTQEEAESYIEDEADEADE